jgi:BioD-like phosphotransacetylase family protein
MPLPHRNMSLLQVDAKGVKRSLSAEALKASMAGFKANATQAAVRLAGAIVTGLPEEQDKYNQAATVVRRGLDDLGIFPVALMPRCEKMEKLTMAEVAHDLDANVLYGRGVLTAQSIDNVEVGTRQLKELISVVQNKPGTLVIASASRFGFLLGMLMAAQVRNALLWPSVRFGRSCGAPPEIAPVRYRADCLASRAVVQRTQDPGHSAHWRQASD